MLARKDELSQVESFHSLQKLADFSVDVCDSKVVLSDSNKFSQIRLSSAQKMQLNNLIQHIPPAIAGNTLAHSYIVRFPSGLPHTLTALNQGGFATMIQNNGKFIGTASLYPAAAQAAVLSAFNVMSAVTGQYFLAKIHEDLTIVNSKLDDILNFLYGDKKAELISEIEFVQYAYANYGSILMHENQCIAVISNLQAARKIAVQDMDFYLNDMKTIIDNKSNDYSQLCDQTTNALKARQCAEMARQLYIMSCILELYYSQNYDEQYLNYVKSDIIRFINKCDKQITALLGSLIGKHTSYKQGTFEKFDNRGREKSLEILNEILEPYQNEDDSPARIALNETLNSLRMETTYYLDQNGQVYVKK